MKILGVRSHAAMLAVLLCSLIIAINAVPVAKGAATKSDSQTGAVQIAWAQNVRKFQPGPNVAAPFNDPTQALGPNNAIAGKSGFVALGNAKGPFNLNPEPPNFPTECESHLIVDLGNTRLIDGDNIDLEVFEVKAFGVAEATWVYIGRESGGNEQWRFAGKLGGNLDGLDISQIAVEGEAFNLVGLCDYPNDVTTPSPWGGPDIDAIGALNFSGSVVLDSGSGLSKNGIPVAPGEYVPIAEGDHFTKFCLSPDSAFCIKQWHEMNIECRQNVILWGKLNWDRKEGDEEAQLKIERMTYDAIIYACGGEPEDEEINLRDFVIFDKPLVVFSVLKSGFEYKVEEATLPIGIETPATYAQSFGETHFSVHHDPEADRTLLRVFDGDLVVEPVAQGVDRFTLNAGQQVVITAAGPGEIVDLEQTFLPLARAGN